MNGDWIEFASGLLFTATWQCAALVVVTVLCAWLVRQAEPRDMLWAGAVLGLVVAPMASLVLPHCFIGAGASREPLHFPAYGLPAVPPGAGADRAAAIHTTLVGVWAAGATWATLRLAVAWVASSGMLRRARPARDPRLPTLLERIDPAARRVEVLELDGLGGPICWQLHRPKIVLPADPQRLDDAELEMILRHEWAHLRRSDPGFLFIQRLVEVIYWFHPLAWWAAWQASKYREFACDDGVLSAGCRPDRYAECLGRLALSYYAPTPLVPAGLGLLWNEHLVLQRVRRLLSTQVSASYATGWAARLAVWVAVATVAVIRADGRSLAAPTHCRWTAWPRWSAGLLDAVGISVRDYPLDAHRYDIQSGREHQSDDSGS
jgi:beta-lactamase regulating signal transducer with metallopeptidase domain